MSRLKKINAILFAIFTICALLLSFTVRIALSPMYTNNQIYAPFSKYCIEFESKNYSGKYTVKEWLDYCSGKKIVFIAEDYGSRSIITTCTSQLLKYLSLPVMAMDDNSILVNTDYKVMILNKNGKNTLRYDGADFPVFATYNARPEESISSVAFIINAKSESIQQFTDYDRIYLCSDDYSKLQSIEQELISKDVGDKYIFHGKLSEDFKQHMKNMKYALQLMLFSIMLIVINSIAFLREWIEYYRFEIGVRSLCGEKAWLTNIWIMLKALKILTIPLICSQIILAVMIFSINRIELLADVRGGLSDRYHFLPGLITAAILIVLVFLIVEYYFVKCAQKGMLKNIKQEYKY